MKTSKQIKIIATRLAFERSTKAQIASAMRRLEAIADDVELLENVFRTAVAVVDAVNFAGVCDEDVELEAAVKKYAQR